MPVGAGLVPCSAARCRAALSRRGGGTSEPALSGDAAPIAQAAHRKANAIAAAVSNA
jgi:hypothetical protein